MNAFAPKILPGEAFDSYFDRLFEAGDPTVPLRTAYGIGANGHDQKILATRTQAGERVLAVSRVVGPSATGSGQLLLVNVDTGKSKHTYAPPQEHLGMVMAGPQDSQTSGDPENLRAILETPGSYTFPAAQLIKQSPAQ